MTEIARNPATARLDYLVGEAHYITFEAPEGAVMQYSRNEFRDLLAMYVREAIRRVTEPPPLVDWSTKTMPGYRCDLCGVDGGTTLSLEECPESRRLMVTESKYPAKNGLSHLWRRVS